ncbi:MAG: hypothetical protein HOP32_08680 [Nitrospira sp.]|nr:hypothetical protein [Nitrospira sp.]
MKNRTAFFTVAAMGLWLAVAAPSQASTITGNPAGHQSGMTYEWEVAMGASDSATFSGSVGAKSWAEPFNPAGEHGWTHTTDWVYLDLTGTGAPTVLTVDLARGATGSLFPAFGIYFGVEDLISDATNHTFNNAGAIAWTPNLTYLGHVANVGGPNGDNSGDGATSVSGSWILDPGLYSLVLGGNPSFLLGATGTPAFTATLTTAPVPVPAAVYLFGSGLIGLAGLARRRMSA